jgi:CPA2 family monovalent cation:H+ antiporter-2
MGELSFVVLSEGLHTDLISASDSRMLFLAIGTLVLTPPLLRLGLSWTHRPSLAAYDAEKHGGQLPPMPEEAIVIGLGPVGRQAASQLEIMGIDVCLIDLSPVNLYPYAQQGFRTISGDARDMAVLDRADGSRSRLAIVCVPDDRAASQIVKTLHSLNSTCTIVVRCRYQGNTATLQKAGAHAVVSEEAEASAAILRLLEGMPQVSAEVGQTK